MNAWMRVPQAPRCSLKHADSRTAHLMWARAGWAAGVRGLGTAEVRGGTVGHGWG